MHCLENQWKVFLMKVVKLLFAVQLVVVAGCVNSSVQSWSTDDLVRSVGRIDMADRNRLAVIDQVLRRKLDPDQHSKLGLVISDVVSSANQSPVVRKRLVGVIARRYRQTGPDWLGLALLNTHNRELRKEIIGVLITLADKKALPYLVVELAGDNRNKELIKTIERIADKPLEDVLNDQLFSEEETRHGNTDKISLLQVRLAALSCLIKLNGRPAEIKTIAEMKPTGLSRFMRQLQFWAERYNYLPTDRMSYWQGQLQLGRLSTEQLEKLRQQVSALNQREAYDFDIRDSHLLLDAPKQILSLSRGQLTTEINARLTKLPHTKRPPSYPGGPDDYHEDFIGQCNQLSTSAKFGCFCKTISPRQTQRWAACVLSTGMKLPLKSISRADMPAIISMWTRRGYCGTVCCA